MSRDRDKNVPPFLHTLLHLYGFLICFLLYLLRDIPHWHDGVDRIIVIVGISSITHCGMLKDRSAWTTVVLWAIVARLLLASAPVYQEQLLSSDINRYLWEGRLVEQGISPYSYQPKSTELYSIRKRHFAIWQYVEHKDVSAIYPPAAQFLFAVLPASIQGFRFVVACCDLLVVALLLIWFRERGNSIGSLMAYAWLPPVIIETAANGHLEGLFLPFMVAGLFFGQRRTYPLLAMALLTIAVAIKFVAVVPFGFLLIYLLRQAEFNQKQKACFIAIPALILSILYLPFMLQGMAYGSIGMFATDWRFNGATFLAVEWVARLVLEGHAHWFAKGLAVWAVVFCGLLLLAKKTPPLESSLYVLLLAVILSPVIYPWYLLWFAPLIPFLQSKVLRATLLLFCCTSFLSYEVLYHPAYWKVSHWVLLAEFLPLFIGFLLFLWTRKAVRTSDKEVILGHS